jgi:hypothetical protein
VPACAQAGRGRCGREPAPRGGLRPPSAVVDPGRRYQGSPTPRLSPLRFRFRQRTCPHRAWEEAAPRVKGAFDAALLTVLLCFWGPPDHTEPDNVSSSQCERPHRQTQPPGVQTFRSFRRKPVRVPCPRDSPVRPSSSPASTPSGNGRLLKPVTDSERGGVPEQATVRPGARKNLEKAGGAPARGRGARLPGAWWQPRVGPAARRSPIILSLPTAARPVSHHFPTGSRKLLAHASGQRLLSCRRSSLASYQY